MRASASAKPSGSAAVLKENVFTLSSATFAKSMALVADAVNPGMVIASSWGLVCGLAQLL